MKFAKVVLGAALVAVLSGSGAWAQATTAAPAKTTTDSTEVKVNNDAPRTPRIDYSTLPIQTYYLTNSGQPNDANEILTAIRNMVPPDSRLFLVASENAILFRGTPDQNAVVQKIINELDRPKKLFRLTYTISEMDGGKRTNTQHFSMMATDGQRVTLKQGSKVPLATGSYSGGGGAGVQTQFQYIDVGMNFDVTPVSVAGGALLKTKVEQSSAADDKVIEGVNEPVIRQATLEGTSVAKLGKPLMLGSLDIPGSTAHLDVEVTVEMAP